MKFPCEIQTFSRTKKGLKINLFVDDEDADDVAAMVAKFMKKPVTMEVLVDKEEYLEQQDRITDEQRKKIYALLKEFANEYGDTPDNVKQMLKEVAKEMGLHIGSLSDCTKEEANDFIEFILKQAMEAGYGFAWKEEQSKQELYCISNKECIVCGEPAKVHILSVGRVALCEEHFHEGRAKGSQFFEDYHIQGVK